MHIWSGVRGAMGRHAVLWAVLAVHAVLMTGIDTIVAPHPDTIDHWVQSRVFSLGYLEHPPMVEWLLSALTAVFGATELGLEISAQIANMGVLALAYGVATITFGPLAAAFTLLFMEAAPYFSAGSIVLQADQPLMVAWLGALAALLAYQRTRRGYWLLVVGLFAGLGGLSKYIMVLFYLGGAAYLILVPAARREWRNPYFYLGGLLALLVVSPVLYWNWQHDWVSIRYQLGKGTHDVGPVGEPAFWFTVGWLFLFGIAPIVWGVRTVWPRVRAEGLRDTPLVLLVIVSLTPLVFFSIVLLPGSFADPKWVNVTFLGLFVALGHVAAELWRSGARRRVVRAVALAHGLNLVLTALLMAHVTWRILPIPIAQDATRKLVGYREAVQEIEALLAGQGRPLPDYVVGSSYSIVAPFALYMSQRPLTYSIDRLGRNLWSDPKDMTMENAIFVCSEDCDRQVLRVQERLGFVVEALGEVRPVVFGVPRAQFGVYGIAGLPEHAPL